jgi:glucokinase
MILAGDVGGTKVHLALYDFIDGKLNTPATSGMRPRTTPAWKRS